MQNQSSNNLNLTLSQILGIERFKLKFEILSTKLHKAGELAQANADFQEERRKAKLWKN